MKIIFLNTWEGKNSKEIEAFLQQHVVDTDVFCFQEANGNMPQLCNTTLIDYNFYITKKHNLLHEEFVQTTYVKKSFTVLQVLPVMFESADIGLGLYTQIQFKNPIINICNFHGISRPGDKLDCPGRLLQSKSLIGFLAGKSGIKIIGGDFNTEKGTNAIKLFEENGYKDLIKIYEIPTTRNHFAWERYPDSKQFYADYVFVSPEVQITNFKVPDSEVSDHLPLILEFDLL